MNKSLYYDSVAYHLQKQNKFTIWYWRNGERYEILPPFQPYAFIKNENASILSTKTNLFKTELRAFNTDDLVTSFEVSSPYLIKFFHTMTDGLHIPTFEADVPYIRNLMDNMHVTCSDYVTKAYFDIEVDDSKGYAYPENPFAPVTDIAITINDQTEYFTGAEQDVILKAFNFLAQSKVHLVCGWNSNSFDVPYLQARMKSKEMFERYRWVDLLPAYLLFTRSRHGSLDNAAETHLKMQKPYIEQKLSSLTVEQRKERNTWDSKVLPLLDKQFLITETLIAMAKESYLFPDQVLSVPKTFKQVATPSRVIDSLLLHKAREMGYVLPNKEQHEKRTFQGALIFSSKSGVYESVGSGDFSSLYPSIIRTYHLSPDREKRMIPEIISYLMRYKTNATNEAQRYGFKVLLNAIYGITASAYFRLYDPTIAEKTAELGRFFITRAINLLSKKTTVLIADTDSAYFITPKENSIQYIKDAMEEINKDVSAYIKSENLESYLEMVPEGYFETFLIPFSSDGKGVKKRYAGKQIWNERKGYIEPKFVIKGMETIRTDWCILARILQKHLLLMILNGENKVAIREYINSVKDNLFAGKYVKELILTKSVNRPIKEYGAGIQHIKAIKKGVEMHFIDEKEIEIDKRVYYIMTHDGPLALKKTNPEIGRYASHNWYYQKQILPIIERLGIQFDDVVQQTL